METNRSHGADAVLLSLEAAAAAARGGFGCLFSGSDEYETALISERRARGHYAPSRSHWPVVMFAGFALAIAGAVLLFN